VLLVLFWVWSVLLLVLSCRRDKERVKEAPWEGRGGIHNDDMDFGFWVLVGLGR
jgi:hypothetical protein